MDDHIVIRTGADKDRDQVNDVYLQAFPDDENQQIAELVTELLAEKPSAAVIDITATAADEVVGHIIFSPVDIEDDKRVRAYILAPLAVRPDFQKHGIGSRLIEHGIDILREQETNIVFVYGDPKYYGRFGFDTDTAQSFAAPYILEHPFGWQAMILKPFQIQSPTRITCLKALSDPKLW